MSRTLHIGPLALVLPAQGMPQIAGWADRPAPGAEALAIRASRNNGMDEPPAAACLLPCGNDGAFGWPAIQGHRDGRHFAPLFQDWRVETQGTATVLHGHDPRAELSLAIRLDAGSPGVLRMSTRLANDGATPYQLDRLMAATMLADAGTLVNFEGSWGREFQRRSDPLGAGVWLQESRRGRTSHDRFPTVFLQGGEAAFALHLGWSGNHVIAIDRLDDGRRLVHAGELFEPGEMRLAPGGSYQSPVAHFAHSEAGIDDLCDRLRTHVRTHVLNWPGATMAPRPVTLNTWEGNYFRHDPAHLIAQARAAAALGIERFVLDDGWFGKRDDDTSSLGDWTVDKRKYPEGLAPLAREVVALGMQFGLWFEPEMVNEDSDLFRAHPDWALQIAGHPLRRSRHQLVLDFSRAEVVDTIFAQMHAVLSALPISYIKWDMNRDLTAPAGRDGRAATAAQTRAVYALMDRIRAAHPALEIESCASGGGRIDYGVLARTHRVWISDCTDALDRLEMQAGAAMLLPPEIMGCHISASPNHQTGRRHSLAFRALVAMAGHFGVEMNPLEMDAAEQIELAGWIALHKRLRPLLHGGGKSARQTIDGRHVHTVASADGARIVVIVAQAGQMLREQPPPLRIAGANAARRWRVAAMHPAKPNFTRITPAQQALLAGTQSFEGAALQAAGFPLPALRPESAVLLELEAGDHDHG